jgi:hypothetical protein
LHCRKTPTKLKMNIADFDKIVLKVNIVFSLLVATVVLKGPRTAPCHGGTLDFR